MGFCFSVRRTFTFFPPLPALAPPTVLNSNSDSSPVPGLIEVLLERFLTPFFWPAAGAARLDKSSSKGEKKREKNCFDCSLL